MLASVSPAPVHIRDVANSAALMAEPARMLMLMRLSDGCALPAGELAREARVSPATASEHLARLVDGGLLSVEPQGRHRYYRLASADVAHAIETVAAISPVAPARPLARQDPVQPIRLARTCYDHLAGLTGVAITQSLISRDFIAEEGETFRVTAGGERWFRDFGIDVDAARAKKRQLARPCLDWTERRHHLAGSLGSAVAERLFDLAWLKQVPEGRWLRITVTGRERMAAEFGFDVPTTASP